MKRKELVRLGSGYVERYVDKGPSRARPWHGLSPRLVGGVSVGTKLPPSNAPS